MTRPDTPTMNARLAERMAELSRDLAGEPTSRTRDEWRFRGKGSLAVMVAGPKRGSWHDHETSTGGGPLGLVAHLRCTPMQTAYGWALAWLGEAPPPKDSARSARAVAPPQASGKADQRKPWSIDLAREMWGEAVAPAGTLVEIYLASRGLSLPAAAPLRFQPLAWRNAKNGPPGPAMVALMTDPVTAKPVGAHITYVRPDGAGKAEGERPKIMLGKVGVIRLVPDKGVTAGLGLAEGIETALAVMQRTGWAPVWAATSAGAVKRFPVVPGIEALTIFADMDDAGLPAARECGRRWAEAGREARLLAPPAGDWDSALPRAGKAF